MKKFIKSIPKKFCAAISLSACLLICFSVLNAAQQERKKPLSRDITSDDFASQRPSQSFTPSSGKAGKNGAKQKKPAKTSRIQYKFVRAEKGLQRRRQSKPAVRNENSSKTSPAIKISEIGLTIWRLRAPRKNEIAPKLPVRLPGGERALWTPERVGVETVFKIGDYIRFAIESSVSGYLYVINSEMLAGEYGEPKLIYPLTETEDNAIRPGVLIEFPAQSEFLPYFDLQTRDKRYQGELLTIVVSPKPIDDWRTGKNGQLKNIEKLEKLEIASEAEIYQATEGLGGTYSEAERQAVCGAQRNQSAIDFKQPATNCNKSNSRSLTRQDPLPQAIYRVKTAVGQPAVLFVRLKVSS